MENSDESVSVLPTIDGLCEVEFVSVFCLLGNVKSRNSGREEIAGILSEL